MKIRKIKKKDFPECAQVILEEWNKQGDDYTKKTALDRITTLFTPGFALCAEEDHKIIGLILATKSNRAKNKYIKINELVVKNNFQGKGIGTNLMTTFEKLLISKNIDIMELNTSKTNYPFYENLGFKPTGYIKVEKVLKV